MFFFKVESISDFVTYHSVLSHQYDGFTTERETNLVHLLRRDIVDCDDEDRLVLLEKSFELVEISSFVSGLAPHFCDRLDENRDISGKSIYYELRLVKIEGDVVKNLAG